MCFLFRFSGWQTLLPRPLRGGAGDFGFLVPIAGLGGASLLGRGCPVLPCGQRAYRWVLGCRNAGRLPLRSPGRRSGRRPIRGSGRGKRETPPADCRFLRPPLPSAVGWLPMGWGVVRCSRRLVSMNGLAWARENCTTRQKFLFCQAAIASFTRCRRGATRAALSPSNATCRPSRSAWTTRNSSRAASPAMAISPRP